MVSIPKGKERDVARRAKALNRSVANYIETLIIGDLGAVQEVKGPYITAKDEFKPPDDPHRPRGDGPRRAVS